MVTKEIRSEKVILLLPDSAKVFRWKNALQDIGIQNFCLAFDIQQALTLLKAFSNAETQTSEVKLVLGDEDLLKKPGFEEFLIFLELQLTPILIVPVNNKTPKIETQRKVRKYLTSQKPSMTKRLMNQRIEAAAEKS